MTQDKDYESLCRIKNVSRETFARMKSHQALLEKWQKSINLVSKNTLPDSWERHFVDSFQLIPHISSNSSVLDMGSGAGFPGLVLAINNYDVTLVESDEKKVQFLKNVSRETFCKSVTIIRDRIEKIPPKFFDVITSRALANLDTLLEWSEKFISQNSTCLFHKGENWFNEIQEAEKNWRFDLENIPSKINPSSCILKINHISKRG
jgi:16S rRNA (guanine527-N7)-methyltransferase